MLGLDFQYFIVTITATVIPWFNHDKFCGKFCLHKINLLTFFYMLFSIGSQAENGMKSNTCGESEFTKEVCYFPN